MPAPNQAACTKLDSCSPGGGKASGGGCYVWATDEQLKKENAKMMAALPKAPGPGAKPGYICAPMVPNQAAAASVCGTTCAKTGLRFGGNWSNDPNNPPVAICGKQGKGQSICGCVP